MNRRREEELIRQIFEGQEESAPTPPQDPEAVRLMASYRSLRDDLKALRDVPEHQLSNDRLREALLRRGLQEIAAPPARRSFLSWAWMPALAGALVFGMLALPRMLTRQDPVIVMVAKLSAPTVAPLERLESAPADASKNDVAAPRSAPATSDSAETPSPETLAVAPANLPAKPRRSGLLAAKPVPAAPREPRRPRLAFTPSALEKPKETAIVADANLALSSFAAPTEPMASVASAPGGAARGGFGRAERAVAKDADQAKAERQVLVELRFGAAEASPTANEVESSTGVLVGG